MQKLKILFKTKGGHKEGMGDVISSLAVARELRKAGSGVSFLINNNKNVINSVSGDRFVFETPEGGTEIGSYVKGKSFDIVVLNQLDTPVAETLLLKRASGMLVSIEDTGESAKLADLSFNILYPARGAIGGFEYIPLAETFKKKHGLPRAINDRVINIMITQGGSDTYGFTPKIVKALSGLPEEIAINVVIGPNFLHYSELDKALSAAKRIFNNIKGKNDISDIMTQADVAISAGGNTLFELACLGVPTIVVCAEIFETITANRLQKEGVCVNLGFGKDVKCQEIYRALEGLIRSKESRSKMSDKGKNLIDGCGAHRMAKEILKQYSVYER